MENKKKQMFLKIIILTLLLFLIFSMGTSFSAEKGLGREWRRYVENDSGQSIIEDTCQKFRNLPTWNEGGLSQDFQDDNMTILQWLTTAETKTQEEDKELKQLMEAFMNADENGKAGKNWKLKVSLDGTSFSETDRLEAKYQTTIDNIEKNDVSSEKEQSNGKEEQKEEEQKLDWKSLKVEDIANIGDMATAQNVYEALLNEQVDYEESKEVINDYVRKLIALKNSLGFKNLQTDNPFFTDRNIEERLRNIAWNDTLMLDADTLASISDKDGGNVNLDVDNTGTPMTHIYKQPDRTSKSSNGGNGIDQIIAFGDIFAKLGSNQQIDKTELQSTFNYIYNIFLQLGVGISVIIGIVLAIKFMLAGIEEKAEVKKMLGVYVIACIVIFGSFGIWKLVINILGSI